MKVLGIDPGMAVTGYGIIKISNISSGMRIAKSGKYQISKKSAQDRSFSGRKTKNNRNFIHVCHGVIRTPADIGTGERLISLRRNLRQIIRTFAPHCVAIERHFFGINSKTAMMVGQARGVLIMTAAEFKLPFFEYQGLAVKKLLTQDGRANKMKIQKRVQRILKMEKHPTPNDAADALAIAIFHLIQ